jgi:hypothetical protein
MAIGRDYPDWGGYPVSGQTYPLKDLAELAARLGSPVTFDRSGAVYCLETFRYGFNAWGTAYYGAALPPTLDKDYSYSDGVAVKLDPGVTTGQYCSIYHWEPRPSLSKWGFACRFSTGGTVGRLYLLMTWGDGTNLWQAWVYVDRKNNLLYVSDANGAAVNVATIPTLLDNPRCFNFIKAVIDPEAHAWCRVRLNSAIYDLSGVGARLLGATGYDYVQLTVQAMSQGTGQQPFYVDDIVMTYNES